MTGYSRNMFPIYDLFSPTAGPAKRDDWPGRAKVLPDDDDEWIGRWSNKPIVLDTHRVYSINHR